MAGTRLGFLTCRGFIEADTFERSKSDLKRETGLNDHQIDDRVEALVWALTHFDGVVDEEAAEITVKQVPNRRLWAAVIPGGTPPLRLYLRPRVGVEGECEWLWIERKP